MFEHGSTTPAHPETPDSTPLTDGPSEERLKLRHGFPLPTPLPL